jgi:hypothetical protein
MAYFPHLQQKGNSAVQGQQPPTPVVSPHGDMSPTKKKNKSRSKIKKSKVPKGTTKTKVLPAAASPSAGVVSTGEKAIATARHSPPVGWCSYPGHDTKGELYWIGSTASAPHVPTFHAKVNQDGTVNVDVAFPDGHQAACVVETVTAAIEVAAAAAQSRCIGSAKQKGRDDMNRRNLRLVARRVELSAAAALLGDVGAQDEMIVCYPRGKSHYEQNEGSPVVFRSRGCPGISTLGKSRCSGCTNMRERLANRCTRAAGDTARSDEGKDPDPRTPITHIAGSPRKAARRMRADAVEKRRLKRAVASFRRVLGDDSDSTQRESVVIKSEEQQLKVAILLQEANRKKKELDNVLEPGSRERAVWDDQIANVEKFVSSGGSRYGFRYSATAIRLGLALLAKCGNSTYDELRQIFFCLPASRGLQDYKGNATSTGVLQANVLLLREKVAEAVTKLEKEGIKVTPDAANALIVSCDECIVSGGVVWSPQNGVVMGFSVMDLNLVGIGNELCRRVQRGEDLAEAGHSRAGRRSDAWRRGRRARRSQPSGESRACYEAACVVRNIRSRSGGVNADCTVCHGVF